jgi:tricorn protease
VKEGDFLLAVNGMPVDIERDPWASFIGTAGEMTEITVSEKPVIDDDARRFLIEPMRGEAGLRFRGWIEHNRKYVAEKSGGRIGYIYVRDTGISGQSDLIRQFFGQRHLDGLIIDERWNGGGQLPHRFVELLDRPLTNYWALRDGRPWYSPSDAHHGPKAMLINGLAGSGGDMFPRLFKQAGLGPLIGTRTWGGLVGISGNPALIDGGYTSVPRFAYFDLDGTWGIEGHGVDPDIEVIDDPALMVDGSDPQLDKAIQVVLEEIERNPPKRPVVPPAPDRSGIGITEEDK